MAGWLRDKQVISSHLSALPNIYTNQDQFTEISPARRNELKGLKKKITSVVVLSEFVFFLKREKLLVEEFVNKVYTSKRLISAYP